MASGPSSVVGVLKWLASGPSSVVGVLKWLASGPSSVVGVLKKFEPGALLHDYIHSYSLFLHNKTFLQATNFSCTYCIVLILYTELVWCIYRFHYNIQC